MQNRPGSDLGGLDSFGPSAYLIRKIAGVQESPGPVPARTQRARYQFPSFRLGYALPQTGPDQIVQNQLGSELVLADCVRFGLHGFRSGSKPMCRNHPARSWPTLLGRSGSDPACFTGSVSCLIIGLPIDERCSVRYVP